LPDLYILKELKQAGNWTVWCYKGLVAKHINSTNLLQNN